MENYILISSIMIFARYGSRWIGGILLVDNQLVELLLSMNENIKKMDNRLESMDKRLIDMDRRLENVETRLENVEESIVELTARVVRVEEECQQLRDQFTKFEDGSSDLVGRLEMLSLYCRVMCLRKK